MFQTDAMKLYALAASVVAIQMILLALWTGTVRARHKRFVNPEDAKLNKGEEVDTEHPAVDRVRRAHLNLMESAIPFFAIGLLYAMTSTSKQGPMIYFGTFVGARLLHSVFYLAQKQPFRTMCFAIGVLAVLGMTVHVIQAAL